MSCMQLLCTTHSSYSIMTLEIFKMLSTASFSRGGELVHNQAQQSKHLELKFTINVIRCMYTYLKRCLFVEHLLWGALPCRAPFQPRSQRRWGGGERTDRIRLQTCICRGGQAGKVTSSSDFDCRKWPTEFCHLPPLVQNGQKQSDPGSLEDLSRDETDRAVPLSEPITIQRRSPLIRNHKTGSMEVRCTQLLICTQKFDFIFFMEKCKQLTLFFFLKSILGDISESCRLDGCTLINTI